MGYLSLFFSSLKRSLPFGFFLTSFLSGNLIFMLCLSAPLQNHLGFSFSNFSSFCLRFSCLHCCNLFTLLSSNFSEPLPGDFLLFLLFIFLLDRLFLEFLAQKFFNLLLLVLLHTNKGGLFRFNHSTFGLSTPSTRFRAQRPQETFRRPLTFGCLVADLTVRC